MNEKMKTVMNRLLTAFPSFDAWFAKQSDEFVDSWSQVLGRVDADCAMQVVDRLINGTIELPPNYEYDRVAILLRREAGYIAEQKAMMSENARLRESRIRYHEEAKTASDELQRFMPALRALCRIGTLCRDHKISHEENQKLAEGVKMWYEHGGTLPEGLAA